MIFTNSKSIRCCLHINSTYLLASTDYDCDNQELMLFALDQKYKKVKSVNLDSRVDSMQQMDEEGNFIIAGGDQIYILSIPDLSFVK